MLVEYKTTTTNGSMSLAILSDFGKEGWVLTAAASIPTGYLHYFRQETAPVEYRIAKVDGLISNPSLADFGISGWILSAVVGTIGGYVYYFHREIPHK